MHFAMVSPAQRHRELIAHLVTERSRLRKTQMMRIRRPPTANQAGLFDRFQEEFGRGEAIVSLSVAAKYRNHHFPDKYYRPPILSSYNCMNRKQWESSKTR
jgi:hypothetical protein